MGLVSVRVSSMLQFDDDSEQDLVDIVNELAQKHKLGEFLSNAVRLAVDKGDTESVDGVTTERLKYIDTVKRGIVIIDNKLNKLYDETEKLKALALMGKRIGIEERADNLYRAQFILRHHRDVLAEAIGVEEAKLEEVSADELRKRAEEVLEFIIESYDNVVGEIKESAVETQVVKHVYSEPDKVQSYTAQTTYDNNSDNSESLLNDDEEAIDFGNADMSSLANFFG